MSTHFISPGPGQRQTPPAGRRRAPQIGAFALLAAAMLPMAAAAQPSVTFGVVGDFGSGGWGGPQTLPARYQVISQAAAGVAAALKENIGTTTFVISLGDQIYQPWLPDVAPVDTAPGMQKDESPPASPTDYGNAIGALYGEYMDFSNVPFYYQPGPGAGSNNGMRFFPVLGDHDWWKQRTRSPGSPTVYGFPGNDNYESYFSGLQPYAGLAACASGTLRWYCVPTDTASGAAPLVQFYALSSDSNEVHLGGLASSTSSTANLASQQITWFSSALQRSTAAWNIAFMHNPPYTTSNPQGGHSPALYFQIFDAVAAQTGTSIDLVLAGHVHSYERLQNTPAGSGIVYIVNGAGGTFESPAPFLGQTSPGQALPETCPVVADTAGSQARVSGYFGYQTVTATPDYLNLRFYGAQDPGNVLASSAPGSLVPGAKPGEWVLLDNFYLVKPGGSVPLDTTATGIMVQAFANDSDSTATVTGVPAGGDTIRANLYGPGTLMVADDGGGPLTFAGATIPAPVANAASAQQSPLPAVYACYSQTGTVTITTGDGGSGGSPAARARARTAQPARPRN